MDDRVISAEGVETAEVFLYSSLNSFLLTLMEFTLQLLLLKPADMKLPYKFLRINVEERLLASSRLSICLPARIRADLPDIFS